MTRVIETTNKRHGNKTNQWCKCINLQKATQSSGTLINCGCCVKRHKPKECPAYGKKCSLCQKPNHFAKVCSTRQPQKPPKQIRSSHKTSRKVDAFEETEMTFSDESATTLFIDLLKIEGIEKPSAWLSTFNTECGNVTFKLDTGAEASVIPSQVFNQLSNTPELRYTKMKLTAYGGTTIRPIGICDLQCMTKHNDHTVRFYIVNTDFQPILSLTDCEKLGLVKIVNSIEVDGFTKEVLQVKYKQVFQGLGNLGESITSHYRKNVHQSYILHAVFFIP